MINLKWDPHSREKFGKQKRVKAWHRAWKKAYSPPSETLMKSLNLNAKQAMDTLLIPAAEQEKYASQL